VEGLLEEAALHSKLAVQDYRAITASFPACHCKPLIILSVRVCMRVASHRISLADGVGDLAAQSSQPGAFNRFLPGQLEAEQQVLLFSWRANHQGERIHTL